MVSKLLKGRGLWLQVSTVKTVVLNMLQVCVHHAHTVCVSITLTVVLCVCVSHNVCVMGTHIQHDSFYSLEL